MGLMRAISELVSLVLIVGVVFTSLIIAYNVFSYMFENTEKYIDLKARIIDLKEEKEYRTIIIGNLYFDYQYKYTVTLELISYGERVENMDVAFRSLDNTVTICYSARCTVLDPHLYTRFPSALEPGEIIKLKVYLFSKTSIIGKVAIIISGKITGKLVERTIILGEK